MSHLRERKKPSPVKCSLPPGILFSIWTRVLYLIATSAQVKSGDHTASGMGYNAPNVELLFMICIYKENHNYEEGRYCRDSTIIYEVAQNIEEPICFHDVIEHQEKLLHILL